MSEQTKPCPYCGKLPCPDWDSPTHPPKERTLAMAATDSASPGPRHPWAELCAIPTCWSVGDDKFHESLLRSFRVLDRVREMLRRGDSRETIQDLIEFTMDRRADGPELACRDRSAEMKIRLLSERLQRTREAVAAP